MTTVVRQVASADWLAEVEAARVEGFTFFDWLGALDEIGRDETITVAVSLVAPSTGSGGTSTGSGARGLDRVRLRTSVPRDGAELASLREVFAGAAWHEREAAELFGITFVGGDQRRLLLPAGFDGTPLRKDEVLGARAGTSWPGAKEPGESGERAPSRRRTVPPGVPDPEVWGDRPVDAGAPDPAEVAASALGGRVRRRR